MRSPSLTIRVDAREHTLELGVLAGLGGRNLGNIEAKRHKHGTEFKLVELVWVR